jgi:hypothetical protein
MAETNSSIEDIQSLLDIYEETKEEIRLAMAATVWLICGGGIYPVPTFSTSAWRLMQKPQN